jgi:hypothetical protein
LELCIPIAYPQASSPNNAEYLFGNRATDPAGPRNGSSTGFGLWVVRKNMATGQGSLELFDAFLRDASPAQAQHSELGQIAEMLQSPIGQSTGAATNGQFFQVG